MQTTLILEMPPFRHFQFAWQIQVWLLQRNIITIFFMSLCHEIQAEYVFVFLCLRPAIFAEQVWGEKKLCEGCCVSSLAADPLDKKIVGAAILLEVLLTGQHHLEYSGMQTLHCKSVLLSVTLSSISLVLSHSFIFSSLFSFRLFATRNIVWAWFRASVSITEAQLTIWLGFLFLLPTDTDTDVAGKINVQHL